MGLLLTLAVGGCDCSDGGGGTNVDTGPGTGIDAGPGGGMDTGPGGPPTDTGPFMRRDGFVPIPDDGGTWMCFITSCDGHVTECGDCEDNDGDTRVDQRDRECLGPCDNTEGPELLAGVGGETGGPCRADCYFDFGNGPGNDDCHWDHRCDPRSVGPTFDPEGPDCEYEMDRVGSDDCPDPQSATCLDVCRPLTPNGCDCFGCCTFPEIEGRAGSEGGEWVWLGSVEEGTNDGTCTFEVITDTTLCRPCTPVEGCWNPCGECEVCIGRPMPPPECFMTPVDAGPRPDGSMPVDGGPPPPMRCDPGVQPCGLPGDAMCPIDFYCVTGCCIPTII